MLYDSVGNLNGVTTLKDWLRHIRQLSLQELTCYTLFAQAKAGRVVTMLCGIKESEES